jgi:SAM-dependent methyltransferase
MKIEQRAFSLEQDEWAHLDFSRRLRSRLAELRGGKVCELGGGAQPALDQEFLTQHDLSCLVVDVSATELEKAPAGYETLVGDVSSADFATGEHDGGYDAVFSRVVAEHVRDGAQFHRNARRLLRPGGIAMHFFPTLWWPPFVLNRLLPEPLAERILLRLAPYRESSGTVGKFPAYYHWCYGPTDRQLKRFETVGFEVEHCVAYFGEPTHLPGRALGRLDAAFTKLMVEHPSYYLTSYATYTLRAR